MKKNIETFKNSILTIYSGNNHHRLKIYQSIKIYAVLPNNRLDRLSRYYLSGQSMYSLYKEINIKRKADTLYTQIKQCC